MRVKGIPFSEMFFNLYFFQTQGSKCFLSLGMNIQILYANIGSLANPQPKIVGAAFVYDVPQEVEYMVSIFF